MANVITALKTYSSVKNAETALRIRLDAAGLSLDAVRWLIAVSPKDGRFVPVLVGMDYVRFAHVGIMVIG